MDKLIYVCVLFAFTANNLVDAIKKDEVLHIAVVACGDRLEETQMMIKSACLLSHNRLYFHIFADDDLRPLFTTQLNTWPDFIRSKFGFGVYPITYPEGENREDWKKLFKPCATQRLFIPSVLKKFTKTPVQRLIYVDTDILFMTAVDKVWKHFDSFNSTHIAGLTPEHEATWMGWYNRFARHPFYGEMGVNSGVMLMDIERIEQTKWLDLMIQYYRTYRYNITWGDQDLINIFFHFYPEKLYVFPCHWNYRPDHCMYGSVCKPADEEGVHVIHGNRGYYHNDKQPAFKAIYQSLRSYKFGQDLEEDWLKPMKKAFENTTHTYCGKTSHLFTKQLQKRIKSIKNLQKQKSEQEQQKQNTENQEENFGENEIKNEDIEKKLHVESDINTGESRNEL